MKPLKYVSKEGFKAYGYDGYFKVPSVVIVTSVIDTRKKQKDNQEKQQKKGKNFAETLASEKEKQQREIICQTSGYSKDAKKCVYDVEMHSYN